MSNDARIMTSLPSHPKTRKLIKRHGQVAAWNLICLFLFARDNKPDGDFSGMAADDIELAADWQGEDGLFVGSLVEIGFLDQTQDGYRIHDWADHNPWAAGAKKRSESAQRNAAKRWGVSCEADAVGINPHSETDESVMQLAQIGNAPSPSPSPLPTPLPLPLPIPTQNQKPLSDKPKVSKVNLEAWLASLADGEDAIPENDPIFDYAAKAGIPVDYLELYWLRFREAMLDKGSKQAGSKGWRAHFRNAVQGNWYKLWYFDGEGKCILTTAGVQQRKVAA